MDRPSLLFPSLPFSSYSPHLAHLGAIIQEWSSTLAAGGRRAGGGRAAGLPKKLRRGAAAAIAAAAAVGALFYEPILLLPSFRHSEPPARSSSQNFLLRSDWTGRGGFLKQRLERTYHLVSW